jgi:2-polyprenyl-3-methyl-5-hydroxy-6-metoxy-1,4-benzoquinol methylase
MLRIRQKLEQMIQGVRQRSQDFVRRLKQKKDADKRPVRELQQEREQRQQAGDRLRQRRNRATAPARTEQLHALPEPDESMHKHRIFRTLLPSLKPGKMLDLGSGRGNFSLAAARLGWEVTAVDARTARTPDPEAEKNPKRAKLIRSVKWVQADVREFPIRSGEYDLICILGLLHHLEVDAQVKLLRRCSGTLTLLDTRIAPEIIDTEGPYEGMYKREHGETREERDQVPTASWGNEVSFRHTEESLLRLVQDCGYSKLMAMRPPHRRNYTFYLCLPPA